MIRPIWWLTASASRWYFALVHRLRVVGRENLPVDGPVLLIANHASFLDPPMVGCVTSRPTFFLARATLSRIPLFGWFLKAVGVRFIDRDGSARAGIAEGISILADGSILCIFPEGTRTPDGALGSFRPGAMLVLRRNPAPVVPVGVRGSFEAWPRSRRLPRPRRCSVHFGAPMSAAEVLAPGGYEELRRRVAALAGHVLDATSSGNRTAVSTPDLVRACGPDSQSVSSTTTSTP